MADNHCPRHDETLAALQSANWPQGCDESLRAHVDACPDCGELAMVVRALLDDHNTVMRETSVPSSAVVWWRAQMRAQHEAVERAAQPMSFVQGVATACAAGILATLAGPYVTTFRSSMAWLSETAEAWRSIPVASAAEGIVSPVGAAFIAAVGLCAVLTSLAIYFTWRED